jgi:hypothetical protein
MKSNELKIGNLVKYTEDQTIFTVDSVSEIGLDVHNNIEKTWIELYQFEPIPLTEEILIRAGFEKMNFEGNDSFIKGDFELDSSFNYTAYEGYIELEYIHRLQNLYFALTGEELEIKL